jgi:hypothetical protein
MRKTYRLVFCDRVIVDTTEINMTYRVCFDDTDTPKRISFPGFEGMEIKVEHSLGGGQHIGTTTEWWWMQNVRGISLWEEEDEE